MLNGTKPDMLRQIGDKVKEQTEDFIAVFAGIADDKRYSLLRVRKNAVSKGANAGKDSSENCRYYRR